MGKCVPVLSQEIIEKILSYVDGETLLTCRDVSPMFAEVVEYLGTKKNIWKKCCKREMQQKISTVDIISKRHPHCEGWTHPKNWKQIYESWSFLKITPRRNMTKVALEVGKKYSQICDILTHGDLILVLVKYNKDFSLFYKILTINKEDCLVDKSCRFYEQKPLYVTPIQNSSNVTDDAILLYCEFCKLMAIPITTSVSEEKSGYPKFSTESNALIAEHSNGDKLWFNNPSGMFGKGDCINISDTIYEQKENVFMNISCGLSNLYIAYEEVHREFNTLTSLRAKVTCAKYYAQLMLLGTETGMLYAYHCNNKKDIIALKLKHYLWREDVSDHALLAIDIAELDDKFLIICCSEKSVYKLAFEREV